MNDEKLDEIILSFLNQKDEFLQFIPETNENLFTIIDISTFLHQSGYPISQKDLYQIISELGKHEIIKKRKHKLVLVNGNINAYLARKRIEKNDPEKLKEDAKKIIKNIEIEYSSIIEPVIFQKAIELIDNYDEMGNTPEIRSCVAFYQANRILNKNYYKNKNIFTLTNKDQSLVNYWNRNFEKKHFDELFNMENAKNLLQTINEIGSHEITQEFKDSKVGAVQGNFRTPEDASLIVKLAGYDLEKRLDQIKDTLVTQVSTGNTAYRKSALDNVGFFDTQFKYGYDNDMSYRLKKAGYKLILRKDAICYHYWKPTLKPLRFLP